MGNTTSERVSGERHGSKSHRSDGSGASHPSKEHPHKIMVGSTDDPSVFSSHDSKVGAGCCLPCPPFCGFSSLAVQGCSPSPVRGLWRAQGLQEVCDVLLWAGRGQGKVDVMVVVSVSQSGSGSHCSDSWG